MQYLYTWWTLDTYESSFFLKFFFLVLIIMIIYFGVLANILKNIVLIDYLESNTWLFRLIKKIIHTSFALTFVFLTSVC